MPPSLSDTLLHPIDTAVGLLRGPNHYVDAAHSSYHMPAGTDVRPVYAGARFAQSGDIIVSVNGNGDRAQLPAEEFHELARNRREPLDPEEMQTIGGFIRLARKMSRERALQIMTAVNSPDDSKNPFRSADTPEMATRATIAAAIKLRETDFFESATNLPELLYQFRLILMEVAIGTREYSFPGESQLYKPAVSRLLTKNVSA